MPKKSSVDIVKRPQSYALLYCAGLLLLYLVAMPFVQALNKPLFEFYVYVAGAAVGIGILSWDTVKGVFGPKYRRSVIVFLVWLAVGFVPAYVYMPQNTEFMVLRGLVGGWITIGVATAFGLGFLS